MYQKFADSDSWIKQRATYGSCNYTKNEKKHRYCKQIALAHVDKVNEQGRAEKFVDENNLLSTEGVTFGFHTI